MRASRLLQILLMLQNRGSMSAAQLATALEQAMPWKSRVPALHVSRVG